MIIFVLTKNGFDETRKIIVNGDAIAWVNGNVLTVDEIQELRKNGVEITNFSYIIAPGDTESIDNAISTIAEHHPGKSIWVERTDNIS